MAKKIKKVKLSAEEKRNLKEKAKYVKIVGGFYKKSKNIVAKLEDDLVLLESEELKVANNNVRNLNISYSKTDKRVRTDAKVLKVLGQLNFFDFTAELDIHGVLTAGNEKLREKYLELKELYDTVEVKAKGVYYANGAGKLFRDKLNEQKAVSEGFLKEYRK